MRRTLTIGLITGLLVAGIGGSYLYLQDKEVLQATGETYKYLEETKAQDKKLDPNNPVDGDLIYEGGPYKLGEVVYVRGLGVKIEPVGISNKVLRENSKIDMEFGVFNLTLYNYSKYPYELKLEDIVFEYTDENGQLYRQPLDAAGYDSWKFIDGSFQFEEMAGEMKRTGKVFFPIKEAAKSNGKVTVYINKVPITFNY